MAGLQVCGRWLPSSHLLHRANARAARGWQRDQALVWHRSLSPPTSSHNTRTARDTQGGKWGWPGTHRPLNPPTWERHHRRWVWLARGLARAHLGGRGRHAEGPGMHRPQPSPSPWHKGPPGEPCSLTSPHSSHADSSTDPPPCHLHLEGLQHSWGRSPGWRVGTAMGAERVCPSAGASGSCCLPPGFQKAMEQSSWALQSTIGAPQGRGGDGPIPKVPSRPRLGCCPGQEQMGSDPTSHAASPAGVSCGPRWAPGSQDTSRTGSVQHARETALSSPGAPQSGDQDPQASRPSL